MKYIYLISLLLCSCASMTEGTHQTIDINTVPSGAECVIKRNGEAIGAVNPTPGQISIDRSKYDLLIVCNKKGYKEAIYFNHSGTEGMVIGSLLAGGLIGYGVDAATGAANKYTSPITVVLQRQ